MIINIRNIKQMDSAIRTMKTSYDMLLQDSTPLKRYKTLFLANLLCLRLRIDEFYALYETAVRPDVKDLKSYTLMLWSLYDALTETDDKKIFVSMSKPIVQINNTWNTIYSFLESISFRTNSGGNWEWNWTNVSTYMKQCYKITQNMWDQIDLPNREYNVIIFNADAQGGNLAKQLLPPRWKTHKQSAHNANIYVQILASDMQYDLLDLPEDMKTKVIRSDIKDLKITNRCADIVFYMPTINIGEALNTGSDKLGSMSRIERELIRAMHTLQNGGIFIAVLPAFILHDEIRLAILKKLKGIRVFSCTDETTTDACILVGKRIPSSAPIDPVSIKHINEYLLADKRYNIEVRVPTIAYAPEFKKMMQFRGTTVAKEIILEKSQDTKFLDILQKKTQQTHSITDKRPLLPFTSGQLGLVLVSGELDGIIHEQSGYSHVIKGMTQKRSYTPPPSPSDSEQLVSSVVTANTVVISLFDAEGNYKRLV